jgi:N-acetylglutamate synthase-like GNAT family acetyltransferase
MMIACQFDFFARSNFRRYPKEKLPKKVWKDCVHYPKDFQWRGDRDAI